MSNNLLSYFYFYEICNRTTPGNHSRSWLYNSTLENGLFNKNNSWKTSPRESWENQRMTWLKLASRWGNPLSFIFSLFTIMTQESWTTLSIEAIWEMEWNINDLHNSIKMDRRVWSWWANSFRVYKDMVYSFKVQWYLLKWYVHIVLDFSDTFTVYFTDKKGMIIERIDMVYIEDLLDIIDSRVETKDNYGQN